MSRLPAKAHAELSIEQQEVNELFNGVANKAFGPNGEKFVYEENNALIGPFPFFLHFPEVGKKYMEVFSALGKLPLPADVRETTILTIGGHFKAGYETYSHVAEATKAGLLSESQANELKDGGKPSDLNEGCSAAYDAARHLVSTPGPLPQHLYDKCVENLGKDATVGMLWYASIYSQVCVALNGIDAPVPK